MSIKTSLILSFSVVFILLITLGGISFSSVYYVTNLLKKLNEHPFAVSNNVRKINSRIVTIHRDMKDIVLSRNKVQIDNIIIKIEQNEKEILRNFKTIQDKYLGKKEDVISFKRDFLNWKKNRNDVINAIKDDKRGYAIELTQTTGAKVVSELQKKSERLIEFASNKALEFNTRAYEIRNKTSKFLYLSLFVFFLIVIAIGIYVLKKIVTPVQKMIKFANKIEEGELTERLVLKQNDDFGVLAKTLNKMAESLMQHDLEVTDSKKILEGEVKSRTYDLEEANRNLIKSEDRFKNIVETMSDWVWEVDENAVYTYASPKVKDFLGYEAEEIIGKTPFALMPEEEADRVGKIFLSFVESRSTFRSIENININKNGVQVLLETSGVPFFDNDGGFLGYRGIDVDITKRKKEELEKQELQKQMFQSSKLSSIGELSAGIGHEINNPMTIIIGHLKLFEMYLKRNKQIDEHLQSLINIQKEACDRIVAIVNGLRTYARSDDNVSAAFDINEAINDTLSFLKVIYEKEGIKVEALLLEKSLMVKGSKGKMIQVFVNLLSNSKDAMENTTDPRLFISTKNLNDKVEIVISDNGCGIKDEIKSKIFDSFYTTKEVGKGTGLGLNITKNIISEFNGTIDLKSEENVGTTFTIRLPDSEKS